MKMSKQNLQNLDKKKKSNSSVTRNAANLENGNWIKLKQQARYLPMKFLRPDKKKSKLSNLFSRSTGEGIFSTKFPSCFKIEMDQYPNRLISIKL